MVERTWRERHEADERLAETIRGFKWRLLLSPRAWREYNRRVQAAYEAARAEWKR